MAEEKVDRNDPFSDLEEIKTETLPFGKIGDWVRGTLTDKTTAPSKFHAGELVNVYEFKSVGGVVHDSDGKVIEVKEGAFYTFWGKAQLDRAMRNVKIGQIFGCQLKEEKPSQKGNPQKIFKVAIGDMDQNYMGETANTTEEIGIDETDQG